MGRRCAIKGCVNNSIPTRSIIFTFPSLSNPLKRKLWEEFVNSANGEQFTGNLDNFGLCNYHFIPSTYIPDTGKKRKLHKDAVPSVFSESSPEFPNTSSLPSVFTLMAENLELKLKLKTVNDEYQKHTTILEKKLEESEKKRSKQDLQLQSILSRFSIGQQTMLLDKTKNHIHWAIDDIVKSLGLYSISRKAYSFVREKWSIPLPCVKTLQNYCSKIILEPNVPIAAVLENLNHRHVNLPLNNNYSQCVLAMDEVTIDKSYCYDSNLDEIFGEENSVTVYCCRGLCEKWKQPLMYTFSPSADDILMLITKLYEVGLKVVACISDMGPKNVGIWKTLGFGKVHRGAVQSTSFLHPMTNEKVWWFPDYPHLLKRLRDQVMDSSITLPGNVILDKSWFKELIDLQKYKELKLTPKLGLKHLFMKGQERQNVSTAFNLFSRTTAAAIRTLLQHREGYDKVARFIEMINNLSDLFNVRYFDNRKSIYETPFGYNFAEQTKFLEEAKEYLALLKVGTRSTSYCPFQKGMIMHIQSLIEMYLSMFANVPYFQYILTSRLNQDYVENLFSQVRGIHGLNSNPNVVELKSRLRKIILKWTVVYEDEARILSKEKPLEETCSTSSQLYSEEVLAMLSVIEDSNHVPEFVITEDFSITQDPNTVLDEGAKEYIAGFIASKFFDSHPEMNIVGANESSRNFWVSNLSNGQLCEPSRYWFAVFLKFEESFRTIYPDPKMIRRDKGIMSRLKLYLQEKYLEIPEEVINYFVKVRIFIRIKFLNKELVNKKYYNEEARWSYNNELAAQSNS